MIGGNTSIGIGVIGGIANNDKLSGIPITIDIAVDTPFYDLPKPPKGLLIIKNRVPQNPIEDYTHVAGTVRINFIPQLTQYDKIIIIPHY